jgi:hypothetical protein
VPFNGAGMFVRVRNWVADATAGIRIRADYHDIEDDGFADGLSQCIARDGQSTILNNIPMNSKRITALADPVNPQDAVTKAYDDLKLPLAGGTITGNLTVTGSIGALGYQNRPGVSGVLNANLFNFNWNGSGVDFWVNSSNQGVIASTAYVETRAEAWAAQYAAPKVNRAGDTMTGTLNTAVGGNIGASGGMNSLWVNGNTSDWAAMTFYSPGSFGANFGIHPNGDFYCGGFSFGAGNAYKFWTERNLTPILNGRLLLVGDGIYNDMAGGVVTGLFTTHIIATSTDYYVVTSGRYRYLQLLTPGGWYTVSSV